ncbi:MAG: aldehyde ferredoxin oxidoreductase C-terminal domain-containing protein [Planctomycetota bacterium]
MSEYTFRLHEPDQAPRNVAIKAGTTIGRDPSNQLCVNDQNVSGCHAVILEGSGGLEIEDVGSSNKTVIVGGPVLGKGNRHPLKNGLVIKMGRTKIEVVVKVAKKKVAKTSAERMPTAVEEPPKTIISQKAPDPEKKPAEKPATATGDSEDRKTTKRTSKTPTAAKPVAAVEKPSDKTPEVKKPEPKKPAPNKATAKPAAKPETTPAAKPGAAPAKKPAATPAKKSEAAPAKKSAPAPVAAADLKSPREFSIKQYRIDLSTYFVKRDTVECADYEDVLGGIGRGFKILEDYEVEDPYDKAAPLIMNLGILSGTQFMTGLRTYFHGYSPLKASLSDKPSAMWSTGSGKFGTKLRHLGVEEVIFTGQAIMPVYLHITHDEANGQPTFQFKPAHHLQGMTINQKIQHLYTQYPDAHFAAIGTAGENYEEVRFAAIGLSTLNQLKSGDMKSRFAGRGGMGGLMGSKNLLAIVADMKDPKPGVKVAGLKEINMEVARGPGSQRFRDAKKGDGGGGTWANMTALNPLHAMPENNFNPTGTDVSVPMYRANVEAAGELMVKDEACYACGISCHKNVYDRTEVKGKVKPGKFHAKLDFEPLNLMSSNIGIFDIHQAVHLVDMVDDYGMDSISCGVTISYAMEYNKRKKEAGEPSLIPDYIEYGNYEGAQRAITEMAKGKLPLLGQGVKRLSEALGETGYAMHCKGVEFPAYLPQFNPGYPWALAGGHMSMKTYLLYVFEKEAGADYWVEAITERGCSIMRDDVIGICKFAALPNEKMAEAIQLMTGLEISEEQLTETVKRCFLRGLKLERTQGFSPEDYRMPLEVHRKYDKVDLEHFNTVEFFEEVHSRVCKSFDEMLLKSGI